MNNVHILKILSLTLFLTSACGSKVNGFQGSESSSGPPGPDWEVVKRVRNSPDVASAEKSLSGAGYIITPESPVRYFKRGDCYQISTYTICDRHYLIKDCYTKGEDSHCVYCYGDSVSEPTNPSNIQKTTTFIPESQGPDAEKTFGGTFLPNH